MASSAKLIRGTTQEIQSVAQKMRSEMTPAEQYPWDALKNKKLNGLRFRAQHPVGQFVLDFYCSRYKLGIELDGAVHANRTDQDAARTEYIAAFGYEILRFRNEEVLQNREAVLNTIVQSIEKRHDIEIDSNDIA